MIRFENCDIFIGTTGIIADSVVASSRNSIESLSLLGFNSQVYVPNGQFTTTFSIDYFPNITSEPILAMITNLINGEEPTKIQIDFAGLNMNLYLESFSIRFAPNEQSKASVEFVAYNESLPTVLYPKRGTIFYDTNRRNFLHAWSTYFYKTNSYTLNSKVYDFSYSFSNKLVPIFKLGTTAPVQVLSTKIEQRITLIQDGTTELTYNSQGVVSPVNKIELGGIEFSHDKSKPSLVFYLKNPKIIESTYEGVVDSFVKNKVAIIDNI